MSFPCGNIYLYVKSVLRDTISSFLKLLNGTFLMIKNVITVAPVTSGLIKVYTANLGQFLTDFNLTVLIMI